MTNREDAEQILARSEQDLAQQEPILVRGEQTLVRALAECTTLRREQAAQILRLIGMPRRPPGLDVEDVEHEVQELTRLLLKLTRLHEELDDALTGQRRVLTKLRDALAKVRGFRDQLSRWRSGL